MKSDRWWETSGAVAYFDLDESDTVNFEAAQLVAVTRQIGAAVVGLRAAGPSAWYRTSLRNHPLPLPTATPDFLSELIDVARREDLRVVAGADFSVAGRTALVMRPEWFARDEHQNPIEIGDGIYRICPLASLHADGLALPALRELAGYELDGLILHHPEALECRCGACRRQFLQVTGLDLPSVGEERSPGYAEWRRWLGATAASTLAAHIQAAGEIKSGLRLVVESAGLAIAPADPTIVAAPDMRRHGDAILLRAARKEAGADIPPWTHGVRTRCGRELSPSGAVWVELPRGEEEREKRGSIEAAGISILAAGGILFNRFTRSPTLDDLAVRALADLAGYHDRSRHRLAGADDHSPVALVWPDTSKSADADLRESVREEFLGFAAAFVAHGVPFAVLPGSLIELERLDAYQAVVLPAVTELSDRQIRAIRRFVGRGRGLLASFTSGLNDASGIPRRQWDLAEMVDADFFGHILELGTDYFAVTTPVDWLGAGLPPDFALPAAHRQVIMRLPEGRKALMSLEFRGDSDGLETDIPFLLGSEDGLMLYCAGEIGRIALEGGTVGVNRLLANAIRRAAGGFVVELRPTPNVELRILRDGSRILAHLQRDASRSREESDVAVGVTFEPGQPPVSANLIAAGEQAKLELTDGCAWAIVPRLHAWELVEFVFAD